MEFNPDFVARMIPKVEWAVLLEAADTVRTLPRPARAHLVAEGGGRVLTAVLCTRPRSGIPRDDLGLSPTAASDRGAQRADSRV